MNVATALQRKAPKQARSTQLVADILEAANRVLEREGAARFTTIRVAETAGVSVGSLYQYFPNKLAILLTLQGATIGAAVSAEGRLHAMIQQLFDREPESRATEERNRAIVECLIAEVAPLANARQRRFAGELLFTIVSKHSAAAQDATETTQMLLGYLTKLQ